MTPENYFDNEPTDTDDDSNNYNNVLLAMLYDCKDTLTSRSLEDLDKVLEKLEIDLQNLRISYYEASNDATLEQLLDNIKGLRKSLKDALKINNIKDRLNAESLLLTAINRIIERFINNYKTRLMSTEETIAQLLSML
jgi:predicted RNA-binding protein with EMAP domain